MYNGTANSELLSLPPYKVPVICTLQFNTMSQSGISNTSKKKAFKLYKEMLITL